MRSVGRIYPVEDAAVWGSIFGDINEQTDLIELLNKLKAQLDSLVQKEAEARDQGDEDLVENIQQEAKKREVMYKELVSMIQASGASTWGQILGSIEDQKDLINYLAHNNGLSINKVEGEYYHYASPYYDDNLEEHTLYKQNVTLFYNDNSSINDKGEMLVDYDHRDFVVDRLLKEEVTDSEGNIHNPLLKNYLDNRIELPVMKKYYDKAYDDYALCVEYTYEEV